MPEYQGVSMKDVVVESSLFEGFKFSTYSTSHSRAHSRIDSSLSQWCLPIRSHAPVLMTRKRCFRCKLCARRLIAFLSNIPLGFTPTVATLSSLPEMTRTSLLYMGVRLLVRSALHDHEWKRLTDKQRTT